MKVTAPPFVDTVTPRRRGRILRITGGNFPRKGAVVLVDGEEARRVRVPRRDLEEDGDGTVLLARVPLRGPALRDPHVVEVFDPRTGVACDPVGYSWE